MKLKNLIAICLFGSVFFFANCSNDTDDEPVTITLTQDILNSSTSLVESLTGMQNGMDFPHNGSGISSDSTIRDIFSTTSSIPGTIAPGTIVTKHTFMRNTDGSKGDLQVTFAMIKHEEGWWPEGNDWEYVSMPFDAAAGVDYAVNPNGLLANAAAMGMVTSCNGCHAGAAGGDHLFSND